MPPEPARPTRVRGQPTRVFHRTLTLSSAGPVVSPKLGGNAVTWHFFVRRQNPVAPLFSGGQALPPGVPASRDGAATRLLGLAGAAGAGVAWVVSLGS